MRYHILVLFTLSFITSIALSQEDYRRWAPSDGVAIRQGHHIEWHNPSSAVRTEGELVGEVAYVWSDFRDDGDRDVYLQVITPEGEFKFEENGIVIVNAPDRQEEPVVHPCSDGGWIIAWEDYHIFNPFRGQGIGRNDIYCSKVDAWGERLWGGDEFMSTVSIFLSSKENLSIVGDGNGGCIITWNDNRAGPSSDIYAMHITNEGQRDARWGENGIPIATGIGGIHHDVISDGEGGLIVCWEEYGMGNIRAQRVSIEGELLWGGAEGITICNQEDAQTRPKLCSDGTGGVFIAWVDDRNQDETGGDIYSQHVDSDGNLLWGDADGGIPLCTAEDDQEEIQITESSEGSAILVWGEVRHRDEDFEPDITGMKITGEDEMLKLWEPEQGVPIAIVERNLENPMLCSDGGGGAFIVWEEERGRDENEIDIRAQRIDTDGQRVWGDEGIIVSNNLTINNHRYKVINPFGNDGCIIGWDVNHSGNTAINTQIFNPEGGLLFEENGIPITQGIADIGYKPKLHSRGNGEFVLVWEDWRFGNQHPVPFIQFCRNAGDDVETQLAPMGMPVVSGDVGEVTNIEAIISEDGSTIVVWEDHRPDQNSSIYLQKVSIEGELLWGDSGIKCAEFDFRQRHPHLCPDAENGVIVFWRAAAENEIDNIYAQRIDQNGEPQWGEAGIQVTDNEVDETVEAIIPDGEGGAIFVWRVSESPDETDDDLYIQRISLDGDKLWGEEGRTICNEWNKQRHAVLVSHPDGYVVVWTDGRDDELGTPQDDIYGQFIDPDGNFLWEESGFLICSAEDHQQYSDVTVDNNGNIWVVWGDDRWDNSDRQKDIYLQKLSLNYDELWEPIVHFPDNGIPACGEPGDQSLPKIVQDGLNGVWVVWQDYRREGSWCDIFATHLRPDGRPFEGWERWGNMVCGGLRSQQKPRISLLTSNGEDGCVIVWEDKRSTGRNEYINIYTQRLDDNLVSVDEKPRKLTPSKYSIDSVYPSPFNSQTVVTFTTPMEGQVSLGLYDVSGRFVCQVSSAWFAAGQHRVSVDGGNLSAGTYVVKMEAGGFVSDVKVTLLR